MVADPRRLALLSTLVGLAVVMTLGACHAPPPGTAGDRRITSNVEDWRDEVIYQILVDRFSDGDLSNNYNVDRSGLRRGQYQGGDWQGIIDKIPYLKTLGVTAIWISPVVRNLESDAGFSSYHGYWTQDFLDVNPHFGDMAKMQELVDALHDNGFKVILDIVTNHIGQLFYYDMNGNGQPDETLFGGGGQSYGSQNEDVPGRLTRASEWDPDYDSRTIQRFTSLGESGPAPIRWVYQPEINRRPIMPKIFQSPSWYHKRGRITVWEAKPGLGSKWCPTAVDNNVELCPYIREQETLGDFPGGLKDLATERADVREALIQSFKFWLEVGDFDGFRIDTLKHVEHGFWQAFSPAMRAHAKRLGKQRFLQFGEAFTGADKLLASYTHHNEVDSVFYFSQKYRVFDGVFKHGVATREIENLHNDRVALYGARPMPGGAGQAPQDILINFMDNHDVARFLDQTTPEALNAALIYLLTTVGIPCIYYGTEQLFDGGNDPGNRESMWLGNPKRQIAPWDTENSTFKQIQTLIKLRKDYAPLRRGDFAITWATDHTGEESDAGIIAYERALGGQRVLVVINSKACTDTKKSSQTSFQGTLMTTGFAPGTKLSNVLPDTDPQDSFTVSAGGTLDITVPCRSGKILVER